MLGGTNQSSSSSSSSIRTPRTPRAAAQGGPLSCSPLGRPPFYLAPARAQQGGATPPPQDALGANVPSHGPRDIPSAEAAPLNTESCPRDNTLDPTTPMEQPEGEEISYGARYFIAYDVRHGSPIAPPWDASGFATCAPPGILPSEHAGSAGPKAFDSETPLPVEPTRGWGGERADLPTLEGQRWAGGRSALAWRSEMEQGGNKALETPMHNASNVEWEREREQESDVRAHTRSMPAASCPSAPLIPEGAWAQDEGGRLRFVPRVSQPRTHTWSSGAGAAAESAGPGPQSSPQSRSHSFGGRLPQWNSFVSVEVPVTQADSTVIERASTGGQLSHRRHPLRESSLTAQLRALAPLSGLRCSSGKQTTGLHQQNFNSGTLRTGLQQEDLNFGASTTGLHHQDFSSGTSTTGLSYLDLNSVPSSTRLQQQGGLEGPPHGEAPLHEGEAGVWGSLLPGSARDLGAQGCAPAPRPGAPGPMRAWGTGPRRGWRTGWQGGGPCPGEGNGGRAGATDGIATQKPSVPLHGWNDKAPSRHQPCATPHPSSLPSTSHPAANRQFSAPRTLSASRVSQLQWIPIDRLGSTGHARGSTLRRSTSLAGGVDNLGGLRHAALAFLQRQTGEASGASQSATVMMPNTVDPTGAASHSATVMTPPMSKANTAGRGGGTAHLARSGKEAAEVVHYNSSNANVPGEQHQTSLSPPETLTLGSEAESPWTSKRHLESSKRVLVGDTSHLSARLEGGALSEPQLLGRGSKAMGGSNELTISHRGSHLGQSEAQFAAVLEETSRKTTPRTQLQPLQALGSQLAGIQADPRQKASRGSITGKAKELSKEISHQSRIAQNETLLLCMDKDAHPQPIEEEGNHCTSSGPNVLGPQIRETFQVRPSPWGIDGETGNQVQPQLPHQGSLPILGLGTSGKGPKAMSETGEDTDSPKRIKLFGRWMFGKPG